MGGRRDEEHGAWAYNVCESHRSRRVGTEGNGWGWRGEGWGWWVGGGGLARTSHKQLALRGSEGEEAREYQGSRKTHTNERVTPRIQQVGRDVVLSISSINKAASDAKAWSAHTW